MMKINEVELVNNKVEGKTSTEWYNLGVEASKNGNFDLAEEVRVLILMPSVFWCLKKSFYSFYSTLLMQIMAL